MQMQPTEARHVHHLAWEDNQYAAAQHNQPSSLGSRSVNRESRYTVPGNRIQPTDDTVEAGDNEEDEGEEEDVDEVLDDM